jgi:hypothetical protein
VGEEVATNPFHGLELAVRSCRQSPDMYRDIMENNYQKITAKK